MNTCKMKAASLRFSISYCYPTTNPPSLPFLIRSLLVKSYSQDRASFPPTLQDFTIAYIPPRFPSVSSNSWIIPWSDSGYLSPTTFPPASLIFCIPSVTSSADDDRSTFFVKKGDEDEEEDIPRLDPQCCRPKDTPLFHPWSF